MNSKLIFTINSDDYSLESLINKHKQELLKDLYITLQSTESAMKIFQDSIVFCRNQIEKYELLLSVDKSNKKIEEELDAWKTQEYIWNFSGFINLISMDIKTLQIGLYFSENQWQKRYYSRYSYTLIYECINDILNFLGKRFTKILEIPYYKSLNNSRLKDLRARINLFKKEHLEIAQEIRNNTFAHKDHDVLSQVNLILNIKWSETIQITNQFENIINDIGSYLTTLIKLGNAHLETIYNFDNINNIV